MEQLTDCRFSILKSAAARGQAYAGTDDDWRAGLDRLAKSAQRVGESYEGAYARVICEGDGARFLACLRKAEVLEHTDARGRPRKYHPGEVTRSKIEAALSDAALKVAAARGVSFESAFALVLATPAGSDLYTALRAAAPVSGG